MAISFGNDGKEKTYGEKMHSNIFDLGINFGLNIVASGVFTYWVKHSTKPVWKNGGKAKFSDLLNRSPADMYEKLVITFQNAPFMGPFKGKRDVAEAMANIFTLNFAGHGVLIPSVWLGDKYHSAIVEHYDKEHYEKNGMEMPDWVKARHKEIRESDKTSFAGSIVSRMGTLAATTGTAYLIGGENNMITLLGRKNNIKLLEKFEGLDKYAGNLGARVGENAEKILPTKWIRVINRAAQKRGEGHSIGQTAKIVGIARDDIPQNFGKLEELRLRKEGAAGINNYTGFLKDFSRYHFLDILYSGVTVLAITPMKAATKLLPGASYKQNFNDLNENNAPKTNIPGVNITRAQNQGLVVQPPAAKISIS